MYHLCDSVGCVHMGVCVCFMGDSISDRDGIKREEEEIFN